MERNIAKTEPFSATRGWGPLSNVVSPMASVRLTNKLTVRPRQSPTAARHHRARLGGDRHKLNHIAS